MMMTMVMMTTTMMMVIPCMQREASYKDSVPTEVPIKPRMIQAVEKIVGWR